MICPMKFNSETVEIHGYLHPDAEPDCEQNYCAWYDEKKKQCAILTLAQKDNSKVSIAR